MTSSIVRVKNMFGNPHMSTIAIMSFKLQRCHDGDAGNVASSMYFMIFLYTSYSIAFLLVFLNLSISFCKQVVWVLVVNWAACFNWYRSNRYGLYKVYNENIVPIRILRQN